MFARLWSNRKPNTQQPRRFRPVLEQLDDRVLLSATPTASLLAPSDGFQGVSGQTRTFTLSAEPGDAGVPAAGYRFTIDWRDGTAPQQITAPSGTTINHTFVTQGSHAITVTAFDGAETSTAFTLPWNILAVEAQGTMCAVGGTSGNDTFEIKFPGTAGEVIAQVNALPPGPCRDITQVQLFGLGGNDALKIVGSNAADNLGLTPTGLKFGDVPILFSSMGVVTFDGQGGLDTLTAGDGNNTWVLDGAYQGSLNGQAFTSVERLVGGSGVDTFRVKPGANFYSTNGGGNYDTTDFTAFDAGVFIDLQTTWTTAVGAMTNVELVLGSSRSDTVIGSNTNTNWGISVTNGFMAGTQIGFSFVENIQGGLGNDTFSFLAAGKLTGKISGGGGVNTLDYNQRTDTQVVNLPIGFATQTGGVNGIQNVVGGAARDIFFGDDQANVLIGNSGNDSIYGGAGNDRLDGGAGNDVLTGGAGNDLLLGGIGRDILVGGSGQDVLTGGGDDDVLLSGLTSYVTESTNVVNGGAFELLMKEWTRTDLDYLARIDHLINGGGLNGATVLDDTTTDDDGVADVLTGGAGDDWFLAGSNDVLVDFLISQDVETLL